MRKIMFLVCGIVMLLTISCGKKDKDVVTPQPSQPLETSVTKSGMLDHTTIAPKTDTFGQFTYYVSPDNRGTTKFNVLIAASFGIDKIFDFKLELKSKKDGTTYPFSTFGPFNQWSTGFTISRDIANRWIYPEGEYEVRMIGKVLDPSVTGTLKSSLQITYVTPDFKEKTLPTVEGQTTTFTTVTFSTSVNSSQTMPASRVLDNKRYTTLVYDITTNMPVKIRKIGIGVITPGIAQNAYFMDGSTQLGTASFTADTAIVQTNFTHPGGTKTYKVDLQLGPVTAATSGGDVKTLINYIEYELPDGSIKAFNTVRTGNVIYVNKVVPRVVYNPTPGPLVNGVERLLYSVTIYNDGPYPLYISQLSYNTTMADLGADSSLKMKLTRFTVENLTISNKLFVRHNGDTVSTLTESDPYFHVRITGSGEIVIPVGGWKTFDVYGISSGFVSAESDAFQIGFRSDGAYTLNRFFNVESNKWQLRLTSTKNATSGGEVVNFGWSDGSAGASHTSIPGLTWGDGHNGYLVVMQVANQTYNRNVSSSSIPIVQALPINEFK